MRWLDLLTSTLLLVLTNTQQTTGSRNSQHLPRKKASLPHWKSTTVDPRKKGHASESSLNPPPLRNLIHHSSHNPLKSQGQDSRFQSKGGGGKGGISLPPILAKVAAKAKAVVKKVATAVKKVAAKVVAVVKKVAAPVAAIASKGGSKTGKAGKAGAAGKAPPPPRTPSFNCATGNDVANAGNGATFSDKQACVACKFVWSNVNNGMATPTTPDLVGQRFDNICAEAPDVFYQGCDDMYDQVGHMIQDFMGGASIDQICGCAQLCAPSTLLGGGSSAKGGAKGGKAGRR